MTRIIAGTLGGRRLEVPSGRTVRPTSDRVREALFSTLGATVHGASVLDMFAGTGALGIEALSRGARSATFVERDRAVAATLRTNLERLGLDPTPSAANPNAATSTAATADTATPSAASRDPAMASRATVWAATAAQFIAAQSAIRYPRDRAGDRFDLVFCDPPYRMQSTDVTALLEQLRDAGCVAHDATMVVERARHAQPLQVPPRVGAVTDVRTYGDTVLYYVRGPVSHQEGQAP